MLVKMKSLKISNKSLPTIGILNRNGNDSIILGITSREADNLAHYDENLSPEASCNKLKEHQL